ncbi:MAG: tRNA (cytidine(56)-2'-O)-methyltransferase [Candidatus Anstonellales archaeon]
MRISVLRLGHRIRRDKRITTHVALVARAFLADEIVLSGEKDNSVIDSISKVVKHWGGSFRASYSKDYISTILSYRKKGYAACHLTMKGEPIKKLLPVLQSKSRILAIVGAEKVPISVYKNSDYNIAITKQPHSEVGALAVFLNILQNSAPLEKW